MRARRLLALGCMVSGQWLAWYTCGRMRAVALLNFPGSQFLLIITCLVYHLYYSRSVISTGVCCDINISAGNSHFLLVLCLLWPMRYPVTPVDR